MTEKSQSTFLLEQLHIGWLETPGQQRFYIAMILLIRGLLLGLLFGLVGGLSLGLFTGIIGTLLVVLIQWLAGTKDRAELLKWSGPKSVSKLLQTIGPDLLVAMILGLYWGHLNIFLGLFLGVFYGLATVWRQIQVGELDTPQIEEDIIPNRNIRLRLKNATTVGSLSILIGLMSGGLIGGLFTQLNDGLSVGLFSGLVVGMFAGIVFGGDDVIRHYTLRLFLFLDDSMPLDYARFLNYAVDRIFLRQVGGGHIFIHRRLQEHFAAIRIPPPPPLLHRVVFSLLRKWLRRSSYAEDFEALLG